MPTKTVNSKEKTSKAFIYDAWLKDDNIGKKGYVLNPKNFIGKFKSE